MPRSVMEHSFAEVPRANIPRSSFNRSHGYKSTFDADLLIPVLVDDIVPGDTFNVNMSFFARLATPLFPIMDNMYLESFFFFVPYRLVWENWARMHGAQDSPGDSISFTVPIHSTGTYLIGDLYDYMGIPIGKPIDDISALPSRAYRLIWNEWFRDENLQNSLSVGTGNGPDVFSRSQFLTTRGKRHDYFTACLPAPQKGTAVSLPLGSSAEIHVSSSELGDIDIFSVGESGYRAMETAGSSLTLNTKIRNRHTKMSQNKLIIPSTGTRITLQ